MKTVIARTLLIILLTSYFSSFSQAVGGTKYIIAEISIIGDTNFSPQTVVTFSGLQEGMEIEIPGKETTDALKKLWGTGLFSDIDLYITKIEGNSAYLEIVLVDLPELKSVEVNGLSKKKTKELLEENSLQPGVKVTENLLTTTKNFEENKHKEKGFYYANVDILTTELKDSVGNPGIDMVVNVDKGKKIKVKDITFYGNEKLKSKKLKKAMKNTKEKMALRFYKRSKYIEGPYQEDLVSVIDKYKENGYRDARITSDSLIVNDDHTISLAINVEEGEQYRYGSIEFIGNTVYSDQQLRNQLRVFPGEVYNGVELEKRIADNENPDAFDLTNLYQNSGYLFSTITPVEVSAEGNIINLEIRITEGKPAYFDRVSIVGNETTNDHVIYRELYTRPGGLYQKSDVLRSYRQLGQLPYLDAQQISPNIQNANPTEGTVDIEYAVVERGASQIEVQGGYGGGGFIGTLGLSFNNFAIKDLFKKDAWKPIPMGDGQSLSLRLQASRFFQTYSFSFTEPWLGGEKPRSLTTSFSHTNQFLFNPITQDADRDRRFTISGITVGTGQRLTVPDDFFQLYTAVSYQHYNLKNYNTGLFTFGDGYSNNLSFTVALTRNNLGVDPIFPTQGSNFNITLKFSLPYSAFNNVDYAALADEREMLEDDLQQDPTDVDAADRIAEIDQERFKWLEFYKVKFTGEWYTSVVKLGQHALVLRPKFEFGYLGAYNQDRGVIPFERFFLGGDGLGQFSLDGRETIQLRGYPNQSLSSVDGGTIYNKFSLEMRFPITLGAQAKVYALAFAEAGASWDNFRDYNPFDLNRSAGFGVRLFMPAFGLLGIDFGYGFDPIPGTLQPNGWETHFIIGQRF